jgi:hypothetical protein
MHIPRVSRPSHWAHLVAIPPAAAIASMVSQMPPDRIVMSDMCTDPLALKAIAGARVAHYNLGLAWPDPHQDLDKMLTAVARDALTAPSPSRQERITYSVTHAAR